jgi:branched-chain amino acid transport system ATP-binding protein
MSTLLHAPASSLPAPPPASASIVVRAERLTKSFGGAAVLRGLDLELRQGEVVLLRGENGSGKTTLLNILTGNVEPDSGIVQYAVDDTPRTFRFPRRWWQGCNPFDHFTPEFVAQESVARAWQDTRLFQSLTLRENVMTARTGQPGENPFMALCAPWRIAPRESEISREADALLARLGLQGRETSSGDRISMGQAKRVAIARTVASGARVLFLDEPLAGLDAAGIAEVVRMLHSLAEDHRITMVLVEHILSQHHLSGLVTSEWLLEDGVIRCSMPEPRAEDAAGDAAALLRRELWFQRLSATAASVRQEPLSGGAWLMRLMPSAERTTPPVLEVSDLVVRRGSRPVMGFGGVRGLDLTVHAGEIAILLAPNGWGKTSLLGAVTGLLRPDRGQVTMHGRRIDGMPTWRRVRAGLQLLPSANFAFPSLTVAENVSLAAAGATLALPSRLLGRRASSLSGGEMQRLGLRQQAARTVDGAVRLFDEPFAMLDETGVRDALPVLRPSPDGGVLIAMPSPLTE